MRNSLLPLAILIFVALVFGGLMVGSGGLPTVEQVSSTNASVTEASDSQLYTLGIIVFVLIVATVGMGGGLAILVRMLNGQIIKSEQQEPTPFEFSLKPEGNSIGAMIQGHTEIIVILIGILLISIFIGLVLFTGGLA